MLEQSYPQWLPEILNWLAWQVTDLFGAPSGLSLHPAVYLLLWSVILFTMIAVVAQVAVIFMVLMERKVLAWMTQRKGPNRVGPWGLLQTLADGVKLLFKEDIMTEFQDKFLFTLGPAIFFLPTFVFFAFIPFTNELFGLPIPSAALLIFALSSISILGIVLAGWASNNKYSLLGGMRSAAQAVSYEIPLVLSVLGVVLYAGTMDMRGIVEAQSGWFLHWNIFWLLPVTFLIFVTSALAEVNRIPFDLPEAESELVSGYNTEYTGMKFALFFLAEYAALFAMCALTVVFFFGGYLNPFGFFFTEAWLFGPLQSAGVSGLPELVLQLEMLFWFMLKTYFFIFCAMWVRATLPRLKPDQLMGFSWKFLIPLSLINIFVISIQTYLFKFAPNPDTPLLTSGDVIGWAVVAALSFGGFFFLMSRLLSRKLDARLAAR